jgi:hypothetical protein
VRLSSDAIRAFGCTRGASSIQKPAPINSAPLARAVWTPGGPSFSNPTNTVSAAITARFITPPTNSSTVELPAAVVRFSTRSPIAAKECSTGTVEFVGLAAFG